MFELREEIKNDYIIDIIYRNHPRAFITAPIIIIFTNESVEDFRHYLSEDWCKVFISDKDKKLKERISLRKEIISFRIRESQKKIMRVSLQTSPKMK